MPLNSTETRVLGCLLEKQRLTPETYPLTLNSLVAACNQSTNREPVLSLGEKEIEGALESLRFEHKLVTVVFGAGARVQKYRHNFADIYQLTPQEIALLTVLLLRGPQTAGELRARTERLADPPLGSVPETESVLDGLANAGEPLVRLLPARPGQKERRYVQLLSGEPSPEIPPSADVAAGETPPARMPGSRLETLANEVAALQAEVQALREEFATFRRQFE
jgi:uncharacterized protein YceH (UPF0502 family)